MPRYFFHLIDSIDITFDPDGIEMPEEGVVDAALLQARDCMSGDVKSGRLDLHYRLDVHDEADELVHTLELQTRWKSSQHHSGKAGFRSPGSCCRSLYMKREELIKKMRGRVDMCRRLARTTTDQRTAETLRQMADEGEADIRRLPTDGSDPSQADPNLSQPQVK